MRLALMSATILTALTACGGGTTDAGPERKSAAGEVLGGEVNDDMLPLDTARSTPPAGRSAPDPEKATAATDGAPTARPEPRLPRPQMSAGPEPYVPSGPEDTPVPAPTAE